MDWSIAVGIAAGLGIPGLGGLVFLVRMESRVTALEDRQVVEDEWKARVETKLDGVARDLNRLIGAQ